MLHKMVECIYSNRRTFTQKRHGSYVTKLTIIRHMLYFINTYLTYMLYAGDNIVRVFYILYFLLFLAKTTYFKETFMYTSERDFFATTRTLFHSIMLKLDGFMITN